MNDLMPKGPNSLNDMLGVMLRFRVYDKVFAFDLSKAYNTMHTSVQERHLRRFVWRWSEDEPWKDYAIDRVHFGDIGASCHPVILLQWKEWLVRRTSLENLMELFQKY